ncbi:hypothetical protein L210DRAFT_3547341 [Boletus edulis BED1]|uniref:F-box domain-containing protein n=1 Tax=Boletus edulis BED1 TaxID=1328754 RepID=A0AAD4GD40_BOLED|nr:hypothetical protein L210DRAFT_3547341 [Boletus edulis BED1]
MPIPDMAVAAEARRVDEEIAKQIRLLCDLQTQRNSFLPISRLPTETLAAIFIYSARNYHSTHSGYPTRTAPDWVNVSYVCRHWRNVALNCATLWSYYLFITSPRWTEELLLHADVYPSRLCFVKRLHLNLPQMCLKDHFLSSPAPRLQNLKMSQFSALFDGDTPALRTLELSRCPVPWYSFTLNGLTTLNLRSNTVEFLATHLYLKDALASTAGFLSSPEFHSFQKIDLPLIAFLACVNIPTKTEVRLDCRFEDGVSLDDYAPLFSALSSPTFRSLVIDLQIGYREIPTFSSLERDCNSFGLMLPQDWGCNTPLKIRARLFVSDTRSDLDCILGKISSFVPLVDVQSLHVINPPVLPAIWRSALGHLPDLRYLKLSSGDLPDLAPVLSLTDITTSEGAEDQGGHTNRSPDRMLAPALEELELDDIFFWKRTKKDKCPVDVQALCDALATRKGSSGQLTITQCIERIRRGKSVQEKRFNTVGSWKNGRYCVVEKHKVT